MESLSCARKLAAETIQKAQTKYKMKYDRKPNQISTGLVSGF